MIRLTDQPDRRRRRRWERPLRRRPGPSCCSWARCEKSPTGGRRPRWSTSATPRWPRRNWPSWRPRPAAAGRSVDCAIVHRSGTGGRRGQRGDCRQRGPSPSGVRGRPVADRPHQGGRADLEEGKLGRRHQRVGAPGHGARDPEPATATDEPADATTMAAEDVHSAKRASGTSAAYRGLPA